MYASTVGDQQLTFSVSGMLWQRSLVMIDAETKSLWSHLLGRAMRGPLEGTALQKLPSIMTDWKSWRDQHPETTVLMMSRTSRHYRRDFYKDPSQFVIGMASGGKARAWPLDQLMRQPMVNDQFDGVPLLVLFDRRSVTAVIYSRQVDNQALEFSFDDEKLIDQQTHTVWNHATGEAVSGPLRGRGLLPALGVVSYGRAWKTFHPDSTFWHATSFAADSDRIRPWPTNPFYWQYHGEPVLLLGGSDDDNLFQWPDDKLRQQLDTLQQVGGNYIRNTMSDRPDKGFEVYPFQQLSGGKYDLQQWNGEYWRRFERLLQWTAQRDIIVQIEIWDRFDFTDQSGSDRWQRHPYNPQNNVNYSYERSGFAPRYLEHPGRNKQPFFFTTPQQRNNTVVLDFQRRFVDKLLSHALKYGHVLYCMDNETKADDQWARYWATFVRQRASEAGVKVCLTEMWDDWDLQADRHRRTFDHPELYDFVDISQNNHNKGQLHWDNAIWVHRYLTGKARPINTVKTYGADGNKFGHSDNDGVERFWRHILCGAASARFHRPASGLGLNRKAQAAIRAARKVESLVKLWDVKAANELLSGRDENEAYLAAAPGVFYVVYFPNGGSVGLELPQGPYALHWIDVSRGEWARQEEIPGSDRVELTSPGKGHWVAAIKRLDGEHR